MTHFNEEYVKYWMERVKSNADGSKVADEEIADFYVGSMGISKADRILDLGCGHGRFFPLLSKYSNQIYGVDVTYEAINAASVHPYVALVKGTAEETNFSGHSFSKIISWGVFDVVEQEQGFVEVNRILKQGGEFLVTGKNDKYSPEDNLAFIAERNAKLKDFPNHFTDVSLLIRGIDKYGFEVVNAFGFQKRGDLGENRFTKLYKDNLDSPYYEFLLILRKVTDVQSAPFKFCSEFSKTAEIKAKSGKFTNMREFFTWHKKNSNE
jgi:ubiquinone/menaquinone biosynthesis C-methylase UbiE